MNVKRKRIIFLMLAVMLAIGAALVLSITLEAQFTESGECMFYKGCEWSAGKMIGNYVIAFLMFIIATIIVLKYLPMKTKKVRKDV